MLQILFLLYQHRTLFYKECRYRLSNVIEHRAIFSKPPGPGGVQMEKQFWNF